MNQEKIGNFIASCRKEQGMTQVQFAEKLGITNKSVSKWETGRCLPDASLFKDICLLLNISLNELFAGERIAAENNEQKFEENLISITTEYQKRDYRVITSAYVFITIIIVSIAINISVGGAWLKGSPVMANFLLSLLCIISWFFFSKLTQEHNSFQKASFVISTIVFITSLAAFILDFLDIDSYITLIVGLPCEILFYGLRIFLNRMPIYAFAALLSLFNLLYTRKNIRRLTAK
ncbi:helix-turn-helix transcriptional regulator [Sedimentibacter hydroxybenzoicus DSM 7310]|uniref:Helix-turn-helix transcriptional regulator n=1 Tax=Sedimentibacter hydroxybenzoicus DSM 7310 TaxID=1123245 RepID=A0A974BLE6_SEDHY|nr:helix-turn-helix transcriptional regulator [Sedimentibacter hydroxybenzoicus]NYB74996.1 helix-turn-helix transcriptional regulator [Sedimentibacter hydroxybenzoicus DSM 7310]